MGKCNGGVREIHTWQGVRVMLLFEKSKKSEKGQENTLESERLGDGLLVLQSQGNEFFQWLE